MLRTTLLTLGLICTGLPAAAQSQDPIQQILANFDQIDSNGDGVISRAEYLDLQAARWPQIDRNGDGYLTEDDFPRFAANRARRQLAEASYLDANGDGRINQSEFVNGPAPVFRNADSNADGFLTRSEVQAAAS